MGRVGSTFSETRVPAWVEIWSPRGGAGRVLGSSVQGCAGPDLGDAGRGGCVRTAKARWVGRVYEILASLPTLCTQFELRIVQTCHVHCTLYGSRPAGPTIIAAGRLFTKLKRQDLIADFSEFFKYAWP